MLLKRVSSTSNRPKPACPTRYGQLPQQRHSKEVFTSQRNQVQTRSREKPHPCDNLAGAGVDLRARLRLLLPNNMEY